MRGRLFDADSSNDCHHGAVPTNTEERKELGTTLVMYFAERNQDEAERAPIGFTNMQFLKLHGKRVNQDLCNLVLHNAVNHAIGRDFQFARIMARLHMNLNCWVQAGKPPVPFFPEDG